MSDARRLRALLGAQATLGGLLFLAGVVGGAVVAWRAEPRFALLAVQGHLDAVVGSHLSVLPAYALVVLGYTLVTFPLLRRHRRLEAVTAGRGGRLRLLGVVAAVDGGVFVLSLGPLLATSPGLVDGIARQLAPVAPGLDVYALYRWHLLDALCVGAGLLGAWAAWCYGRAAWGRLRAVPRGPRLAALAAVLAIPGLAAALADDRAPAPPPAREGPLNVLIIAGDSLRADHLGVHGYHRRDISPHIDAFAADAVDLRQMHVATASTLESWMTVMSGQFPPTHGVRYMYVGREVAERVARRDDLLPRIFRKRGYYTTVVSDWAGNCFRLLDMGFERNLAADVQNFDTFVLEATLRAHPLFTLYFANGLGERLVPGIRKVTHYVRPGALADRMLAEIDEAGRRGQPFFGVLFFSTTHLPYNVSYPFSRKYVDPDYDGPHRHHIEVQVHDLITDGFDPDLPPAVRQHIRDLYDGAVSELDHYVGRVLEGLKDRGLYERTLIIVTSDHGEDLYDPGSTLGHGTNFFGGDQSTRIPFFIRVPGVTEPGRVVEALTRNADVAPTLLSLLDIPAPPTHEGVDLTPLLTGAASDLDLPVFAETCYLFFPKDRALVDLTPDERARLLSVEGAGETLIVDPTFDDNLVLRPDLHDAVIATKDRMIRTRRWKLVHIPARGRPIYRLYDIQADPTQRHDLADRGRPVMARLIGHLDRYWRGEGADLRWPPSAEAPDR